MIPKEKAEELVLKYLRVDNNAQEWFNTYIAKQCALIAVDEIIRVLQDEQDWYWQDVKTELEKL